MKKKHCWLWLLLSLLVCQPSMGQQTPTDAELVHTLYFHVGKSDFDPLFRNNGRVMSDVINQINALCAKPSTEIRCIKVATSTSPEGGKALNVRLASQRSLSIVNYLVRMYPDLTQQIVISSELAPDWEMLRQKVMMGNMEYRTRVLEILDQYRAYQNPDYSVVDPREALIKNIEKGKVWKYMLDTYYPDMRYAKVELLHDLADINNANITEVVAPKVAPTQAQDVPDTYKQELPRQKFLFALKSNLLFDAFGAINGEIEVPLGRHWSAQAEVVWPWLVHSNDRWCEQMGLIDGEVRYWLGNHCIGNPIDPTRRHNPLTGHFFGVTGGWGYYDFELKNQGYQGEGYMAGITYGYSMRLNRHFNMEFSIGLGYAHTKVRHYEARYLEEDADDKKLVKDFSDKYNWFGPIKAKVSLSWLIFNKKK